MKSDKQPRQKPLFIDIKACLQQMLEKSFFDLIFSQKYRNKAEKILKFRRSPRDWNRNEPNNMRSGALKPTKDAPRSAARVTRAGPERWSPFRLAYYELLNDEFWRLVCQRRG